MNTLRETENIPSMHPWKNSVWKWGEGEEVELYILHIIKILLELKTKLKKNKGKKNNSTYTQKKTKLYSPIHIFQVRKNSNIFIKSTGTLSSLCKYSLHFCQQIFMLIFWIKISAMPGGTLQKVARLNCGSCLHVSSTQNNHMVLNVCRSLWRFTVIMSWCAYCYSFSSFSCLSTCFVQEQLLASRCCLFQAQRPNEEMLSREVMFQSRNSNNKCIQWGNIKFTGQKSRDQTVLI